jgi:hypothetical protein
MTSIRKTWWAALALSAFVGCNTEEPAATPTNPEPVTNVPAPTGPPGAPPTATAPTTKPETPPAIEAPTTKPSDEKKSDEKKDEGKKDVDKKAENAKLSDEEIAEIKKLPADDQLLAMKQMVCPVSDEHLGEMGVPVKVTAEGKSFFLCCAKCKKEVDKDAKAVLAKLKD